jgi:hypothetical protein
MQGSRSAWEYALRDGTDSNNESDGFRKTQQLLQLFNFSGSDSRAIRIAARGPRCPLVASVTMTSSSHTQCQPVGRHRTGTV